MKSVVTKLVSEKRRVRYASTFLTLAYYLSGCQSDQNSNPAVTEPDLFSKDIAALKTNPDICQGAQGINWLALTQANCNWLSDYGLFSGPPNDPTYVNSPGLLYKLNSALFTDHAQKYRYIFLPQDSRMGFHPQDTFDFPEGSVLVKVFALPNSVNIDETVKPTTQEERLVEVRLQIKRKQGWVLLPYVWHPDSQDAYLHLAGKTVSHTYTNINDDSHSVPSQQFNYEIPSASRCQLCHQHDNTFSPIGPKARHLNRTLFYQGQSHAQLQLWQSLGMIEGVPQDLSQLDTAPNWQDSTASLKDRAKAYLDINCAHCHSDHGSAALSGLRLEYWRKDVDYLHGVCNSSHGWRGGGFDIWPGEGAASSIPRRMNMTQAKDRMPPVGRTLIDSHAVKLIEQWIDEMPYQDCQDYGL